MLERWIEAKVEIVGEIADRTEDLKEVIEEGGEVVEEDLEAKGNSENNQTLEGDFKAKAVNVEANVVVEAEVEEEAVEMVVEIEEALKKILAEEEVVEERWNVLSVKE